MRLLNQYGFRIRCKILDL